LVYKQNDDGESKTHIRELNKEERLQEIAKMLSGDTVTAEAIENARVLLK
jgi:DNA repair protein RecN (Recombination protein N)